MGAASFLATPSVSPRALNAVSAFTQMHWENIQLPIETQKHRLYPMLWDRHARGATMGSRKCWEKKSREKASFLQVFALGVQPMLVVRSKRSHKVWRPLWTHKPVCEYNVVVWCGVQWITNTNAHKAKHAYSPGLVMVRRSSLRCCWKRYKDLLSERWN